LRLLSGVVLFALFLIIFLLEGFAVEKNATEAVDKNVIIIPKGESRSFMLTNHDATFFSGETGSLTRSSFHGMNVNTHEFFEDYILEVEGTMLKREDAEVYLHPDKLVRSYPNVNLNEEITLLDTIPVLVIKLTSENKRQLSFLPHFSEIRRSKNFVTYWSEDDRLLYIANQNHLERNSKEDYPVWTGIYIFPNADFNSTDVDLRQSYVGLVRKDVFLPGELSFQLDTTAYIFIIVGDDKKDIVSVRQRILKHFNIFLEKNTKNIKGIRGT